MTPSFSAQFVLPGAAFVFGRKKSVERVVPIAEYSRLVPLFDAPAIGEKTLLAKFAKLTKIS